MAERKNLLKEFQLNKKVLKHNYFIFLEKNYPHIKAKNTAFSDAIFMTNNPELGYDIYEVIHDPGLINDYEVSLQLWFLKKGYPSDNAKQKAKGYINSFLRFREFIDAAI